MAAPLDSWIKTPSTNSSDHTGEGVIIDNQLVPAYLAAGFETIERGILSACEWPDLNTSWAKRLQGNEYRTITYLIARTV